MPLIEPNGTIGVVLNSADASEWDTFAGKAPVDNVNRPPHYNQGGIECITYLADNLAPVAFRGYLEGNTKKYLHRWLYKGGVEDLKKAQWYLDRWIKEIENNG